MKFDPIDALTPRILVVDDERQIHSTLKLRLGRDYDLSFASDGISALNLLQSERFDLCLADIRMPGLDGLRFVEKARELDPALGFVILSAFGTDENLRRAIPLQVFDFIGKPLPERADFEAKIPDWVGRTRRQRRNSSMADHAESIIDDLASARMAQEIEVVASETARDALLQTSNLLTTIHAHLVTAISIHSTRSRSEPGQAHLQRNLEEARKTADVAMSVAEGFFDSAYGSRDHSPAVVMPGVNLAVEIARRTSGSDEQNKYVDISPLDRPLSVRGLSGIEFLLLMVPSIGVALACAPLNSTIGITVQAVQRLDVMPPDAKPTDYLWVNRRNAVVGQAGVMFTITAAAPAFSRTDGEAWLKGNNRNLSAITARGLINGVKKCRGVLGIAIAPFSEEFRLTLALPT